MTDHTLALFGGTDHLRTIDLEGILSDRAIRSSVERSDDAARNLGLPPLPRSTQELVDGRGHRPEVYLALTSLQIALFEREEAEGKEFDAIYSRGAGHPAAAFAAGSVGRAGALIVANAFATAHADCVLPEGGFAAGEGVWISDPEGFVPPETFEETQTAVATDYGSGRVLALGPSVSMLRKRLGELGVSYRALPHTAIPLAHTPFLRPAEPLIRSACSDAPSRPPTRPWFSAARGVWVCEAPDVSFWWDSLLEVVRAGRDATVLRDAGFNHAVEIGQMTSVGRLSFGSLMDVRSLIDSRTPAGGRALTRRVVVRAQRVAQKLVRPLAHRRPAAVKAADALGTDEGWRDWHRHVATLRVAGGLVQGSDRTWYVTGYDTAKGVLKDADSFSSSPDLSFDRVLLGADGKRHRIVRQPLTEAFSSRTLGGRAEPIREVAVETLLSMETEQEEDLVRGFTVPFTLRLTWDLLGLRGYPTSQLMAWGASVETAIPTNHSLDGVDPEFRAVIAELYRRACEGKGDEVLTALGRTEAGSSPGAFWSVLRSLLLAGFLTTKNLIGSTVLLLARHPQVEAAVRADRALIPGLLEEALRLDPPLQYVRRRATRQTEIEGRRIAPGTLISVLIRAANRDPAVFDAPDEIRLSRTRRALSFGYGPHFCLGSYWALEKAKVGTNVLLDAWPDLGRAVDVRRVSVPPQNLHGPAQLPMLTPPCVHS